MTKEKSLYSLDHLFNNYSFLYDGSFKISLSFKIWIGKHTLIVILLTEQVKVYELAVIHQLREYGAYIVIITAISENEMQYADRIAE